jgi:hypothetical protein
MGTFRPTCGCAAFNCQKGNPIAGTALANCRKGPDCRAQEGPLDGGLGSLQRTGAFLRTAGVLSAQLLAFCRSVEIGAERIASHLNARAVAVR